MAEWWNSLNTLQYVFFFIAVPSFVFFILQTILAFVGGDQDLNGDGEVDMDFDLDSLNIFTLRGIMAFFSLGGTVGFFVAEDEKLWWLAILLSLVFGTLALVGMAFLLKAILKLQSSGNIKPENSIGRDGTIYIMVPGKRSGIGKVNVLVQERLTEYDCVTDEEAIETGAGVVIEKIENGIFVVRRK